jgi:tetratricopeptide (TPR) repeat protein
MSIHNTQAITAKAQINLSLCMIVKDEAQRLPRCLQSVQGVVDETIVVDTGSSDRTIKIAQEFGANVYHFPWNDDFAAARNESLKYAKGAWILVLDADETLLEDCIPNLQRAIQNRNHLAITLLRHEIGAQQNPYTLVARLFRRHPQIQFQRSYHESIDDPVSALILESPHWKVVGLSEPAIAHDGYQADIISTRNKGARAERIMGQYLAQNPQDAYICSKLGGLYLSQGQTAKGLVTLEQGLAQSPTQPAVVYELHYHLGVAYKAADQLSLAQHYYEQALTADLADVLKIAAFINLAALYTDQGQWENAQDLLSQVLRIQPDLVIAHYNLGLTYKAQGQYPNAIAAYQATLQLDPNYAEAHQNLGVVYFKLGQMPESLSAFRQAIALHDHHNPTEALRLRTTLKDLGFEV